MRQLSLVVAACLVGCGPNEPRLVTAADIIDDEIPASLTPTPGDPNRGETVFVSREFGHCVLCHVVEGLEAEFQGNVGPDLSKVGERLSPGQLRLRIVDYQIVQSGTVMPSYYRIHDLYQVGTDYFGDPVLSTQHVEDLVAYLSRQRDTEHD